MSPSSPPTAVLRTAEEQSKGRLSTRLWWMTAICVLVALGLMLSSFRSQGTTITIHFSEGHGLKPGDTLRYRGIDIGRVTSVGLNSALDGVDVKILLEPANQRVAVDGSQFWIQRAKLSLGGVSGIDTVLGAKYVGVIPGDGATKLEFEGTETPLMLTDADDSEIRIRFPAGEGLDVGNPVRFRGIKVGEVVGIALNSDLQGVDVQVRLVGAAKNLARVGTQFWIERPRIDLTEVRGLDTVIAGNYIALQPHSSSAALATSFEGLSEPPPLPRREGSLEVELDAPQRMGIVRGAPVIYRGLEVGRVANVGLSKDGATVKITAIIDTEYAEMVRENSRWWAVGGIEFDAGLSGFKVSVESLSTWVRGGVAFATPEKEPGKQAVTGYRFMLEEKPEKEWLNWQPRIAIGGRGRTVVGKHYPTAVRVVATWKTSVLGIPRRHSEKSWGLALSDGTVALPSRFLKAAAEPNVVVTIEIAGVSFPWSSDLATSTAAVGVLKLPIDLPTESGVERWSRDQVADEWSSKMVVQVVNPELTEPIAIDSTRLEVEEGVGLKVAPGVPIAPGLNGSPVVNAATGQVIGLLSSSDSGWIVGKLPSTAK